MTIYLQQFLFLQRFQFKNNNNYYYYYLLLVNYYTGSVLPEKTIPQQLLCVKTKHAR